MHFGPAPPFLYYNVAYIWMQDDEALAMIHFTPCLLQLGKHSLWIWGQIGSHSLTAVLDIL